MKRRFHFLGIAALLAALLGIWLAWYTRPRTVENLLSQFHWEDIENVECGSVHIFNTELDRDWTRVMGYDIDPLSPQEIEELLTLWREAELRPKPLSTFRRQQGVPSMWSPNRTGRRYYGFSLLIQTDLGDLWVSDHRDGVELRWKLDNGQEDQLWVVSPPPDLMAQTSDLLLSWAEHVEYDPE